MLGLCCRRRPCWGPIDKPRLQIRIRHQTGAVAAKQAIPISGHSMIQQIFNTGGQEAAYPKQRPAPRQSPHCGRKGIQPLIGLAIHNHQHGFKPILRKAQITEKPLSQV